MCSVNEGAWPDDEQMKAHKTPGVSITLEEEEEEEKDEEEEERSRQAKPLHHLWRGRYRNDLNGNGEKETETQREARVNQMGWIKDDLEKVKEVCLSAR